MGVSENNILQTDFEQKKNSCKEIPATQWLCMSAKNILSPEVSGKKNSPPPPLKSQMVRCSLFLLARINRR